MALIRKDFRNKNWLTSRRTEMWIGGETKGFEWGVDCIHRNQQVVWREQKDFPEWTTVCTVGITRKGVEKFMK